MYFYLHEYLIEEMKIFMFENIHVQKEDFILH